LGDDILPDVIVIASQVTVLGVVVDRPQAFPALRLGLVGCLPGEVSGVQTTAHGLAHFVAGEPGTQGAEEEFVIVERIHGDIALLIEEVIPIYRWYCKAR
jgi:hypothetical protein